MPPVAEIVNQERNHDEEQHAEQKRKNQLLRERARQRRRVLVAFGLPAQREVFAQPQEHRGEEDDR